MRLVSVVDFSIHEFASGKIPPYAILSHTWGAEELSFQDMQDLKYARKKKGFGKIELCCKQALADGWSWAWVDTCCIDKTSSVELSEAVNSMFRWYEASMVCYAYLSDCFAGGVRSSRWFSRGWTLQELIAPLVVKFYDYEWTLLGTKRELQGLLSDITGVPAGVLDHSEPLSGQSVARRMHWGSRRETTREEDMAYCLLGIFNVNMPLLYGEGAKAFLRLQEEIVRTCDDHTLFLWDLLPNMSRIYQSTLEYREEQAYQEFHRLSRDRDDNFDSYDRIYDRMTSLYGQDQADSLSSFLSRTSIKPPRNWKMRGIMADHPSRFATCSTAVPLGLLRNEDLPRITSRGVRLSLFLNSVTEQTYLPLLEYMDIAKGLGRSAAIPQFDAELRSYEDSLSAFVSVGKQWRAWPTYLAALDCSGPGSEFEASQDLSVAGPSRGKQAATQSCAAILLLKMPGSNRSEFLRAPYFCQTVPIGEVMTTWQLTTCYIKANHNPTIPKPTVCDVKRGQPDFGYDIAGRAWSGGFFTSFRLESAKMPRSVLFVTCGVRPGCGFLDARKATSRPSRDPETEEDDLDGRSHPYGHDCDPSDSENEIGDICSYWAGQGIIGRLDWMRGGMTLGPAFEAEFEIDDRTLTLTLVYEGPTEDIDADTPDLAVDQYTLWLAWKKPVGKVAKLGIK